MCTLDPFTLHSSGQAGFYSRKPAHHNEVKTSTLSRTPRLHTESRDFGGQGTCWFVPRERFELTTYGLEVRCSIQLSYRGR